MRKQAYRGHFSLELTRDVHVPNVQFFHTHCCALVDTNSNKETVDTAAGDGEL